MKALKKISPVEFRLHQKLFFIDFTPSNYFENFRVEIIFQRLFFWFFKFYGIYFYIQQLKLRHQTLFFQFYFYKTYMFRRFIQLGSARKLAYALTSLQRRKLRKRRRRKIKRKFSVKKIRRVRKFSGCILFVILNKYGVQRLKKKWAKKRLRKRTKTHRKNSKLNLATPYSFFFVYFFLHFFNYRSVVLYKSLYKYLCLNSFFKAEQRLLLAKTRYLQRQKWSFDFLFLVNYTVTFANTNFLLPFFIYHVKAAYKQLGFIYALLNSIRVMYFLKANIRGVKVLVHGTFDRHGRSQTFVKRLGYIAYLEYRAFILYDSIQWPTLYGMTTLKIWVQYFNY